MADRYDAIVIGLGGMGSAAAYHLARRGKRVLGLEQFDLLHELGSSHGVTRIIRLAYHEDPSYVPLLRRAYELWHDLENDAGERLLSLRARSRAGRRTGARSVARSRRPSFTICHTRCSTRPRCDAGTRRMPDSTRRRGVVFQPEGGFLLAERTILAHVNGALAAGAQLRFREPVLAWEPIGEGVRVVTESGSHDADRLVVCAGAWARTLVPELDRLAVPERQVLAWLQPTRVELFEPDRFPVFLIDVEEGSHYGFPVHDVPGFKFGRYHHLGESIDPSDPDRSVTRRRGGAAGVRRALLPRRSRADGDAQGVHVHELADEHFLLGTMPDAPQISLFAGESGHGYKFASVVGEILADLAVDGVTRHDIGLFGLDRFAAGLPAAGRPEHVA